MENTSCPCCWFIGLVLKGQSQMITITPPQTLTDTY